MQKKEEKNYILKIVLIKRKLPSPIQTLYKITLLLQCFEEYLDW